MSGQERVRLVSERLTFSEEFIHYLGACGDHWPQLAAVHDLSGAGGGVPDQPRYLITILLDEPQPLPETHGFATSGWNAAPTAGKVVTRIAPLLGLEPRFDLPAADRLILAKASGQ